MESLLITSASVMLDARMCPESEYRYLDCMCENTDHLKELSPSRPRPSLDILEIEQLIASHLDIPSALDLAYTCKALRQAEESRVYRVYQPVPTIYEDEADDSSDTEDEIQVPGFQIRSIR